MNDIVTKEMLETYRAKHWILEGELTFNTIAQAVELLERWENCFGGGSNVSHETQAFLDRYHAGEKEIRK